MILILSLSPLVDIVSQGLGPHQSQIKEWNEHDMQFEGRSCREQELEARRNCMRERQVGVERERRCSVHSLARRLVAASSSHRLFSSVSVD